MNDNIIFLDSYKLQADSRIRLPKSAIENLRAVPGETRFKIYYDNMHKSLMLVLVEEKEEVANEEDDRKS